MKRRFSNKTADVHSSLARRIATSSSHDVLDECAVIDAVCPDSGFRCADSDSEGFICASAPSSPAVSEDGASSQSDAGAGVKTSCEEISITIPADDSDEDEIDPSTDGGLRTESGWIVGRNCGPYIHPYRAPLGVQGQVFVANAAQRLQALGNSSLAAVTDIVLGHDRKLAGNRIEKLVSRLFGMTAYSVRSVLSKLQAGEFVPALPLPRFCAKRSRDSAEARGSDLATLVTLTREALANAYFGNTDEYFVHTLARMRAHGVDVGDKYHHGGFARDVEHLAKVAVVWHTVRNAKHVLPGLRIPSDFAIILDPVSIGTKAYSRNETLVLTGLHIVSHVDLGFEDRLLTAPSQGAHKDGVSSRDLVIDALSGLPNGFRRRRLQASLACVGGDGGLCIGGPDARHKSTKAAELIFQHVHADFATPLTHWDLFHRIEVAGQRAVSKCALALEIFDVNVVLVQLFAIGQGRVLHRSIVGYLQDDAESCDYVKPQENGGTRPMAYAGRTCESLLRNYRSFHFSLEARIAQRRQGHACCCSFVCSCERLMLYELFG